MHDELRALRDFVTRMIVYRERELDDSQSREDVVYYQSAIKALYEVRDEIDEAIKRVESGVKG